MSNHHAAFIWMLLLVVLLFPNNGTLALPSRPVTTRVVFAAPSAVHGSSNPRTPKDNGEMASWRAATGHTDALWLQLRGGASTSSLGGGLEAAPGLDALDPLVSAWRTPSRVASVCL